MPRLTITTHPRLDGHKAVDMECRRIVGEDQHDHVKILLTRDQAIEIMDDLRAQIDYTVDQSG